MPARKPIPLLFLLITGMSIGDATAATSERFRNFSPLADEAPVVITAPTAADASSAVKAAPVTPSSPVPSSASSAPAAPSTIADYFPVLPSEAPPEVAPSYVPVAANFPLMADHKDIGTVVIYIHDGSRDARRAADTLRTLAGPAETATMIIAPQFMIEEDMAAVSAASPPMAKLFARWPYGGWEGGGDSVAEPPARGISSFTVIDLLLMYASDKALFPHVRQIVLAGMGPGGNFVQRYAAIGRGTDIVLKQGTPLRFVAADASSYLYLTPSRFLGGRNGFGVVDDKACPAYNAWPYGLDSLNNYGRHVGANAAKLGYNNRQVAFMLGAAANIGVGDNNCAAAAQGADERTRMQVYQIYLKSIYGEDVGQRQTFTSIPKAGYDMAALFGSACGMSFLFGDGSCADTSFGGSNTVSLRNSGNR